MILTLVEPFEMQGKKKVLRKAGIIFIFLLASLEVKKKKKRKLI